MSIALIVGCGYLGRALARRLLGSGALVYGTSRTAHTAAQLASLGIRPMMVSVTQPVTHAALRPALEAESLDVYYMVPPGRPGVSPTPRQTVLGGIAHTIKSLRSARVRRAVLVSSTAVYGQSQGEHVDADTPAEPYDTRGKLMLEGEQLWLAAGNGEGSGAEGTGSRRHHVVRLAGLYGPGRVIGLDAVRSGAPLLGDPHALLNLIHVDDAAALLEAVATCDTAGAVELGCDGNPVPRIDYYTHLARRIGVPPPEPMDATLAAIQLGVDPARLRRASSKALDNIPTCRRTGWTPTYPTYRLGLDASL